MVTAHPSSFGKQDPAEISLPVMPPLEFELTENLVAEADQVPARKCLVTGTIKAKTALIRFVVGPDLSIVPDLAENLPGRGLWVSAEHAVLQQAVSKNLFSKSAKQKVKASADLPDLVASLLAKRCLELLGLARGAGLVVSGQAQVEQVVKNDELAYLLIASDAGQDGLKKLGYGKLPIYRALDRTQLGAALGHDHLVYLGIRPHKLTAKLATELTRLTGVHPITPVTSPLNIDLEKQSND